ncbi:MAG: ankyrin repeat domain-containing protein [Gemmatimonadota bacterium]
MAAYMPEGRVGPDGWTPLACAVEQGNAEAVRVLLDRGANTDARAPDGRSLVELATDQGSEEIAGMLRRVKA